MSDVAEETLVADHVLEYPGGYTRSVGPAIGRFLTSLRDGRLEGVRVSDGRVLVPPTEYDPVTAGAVADDAWVEVGPAATVETWTWVAEPRPGKHPLTRPFAFALVRPDGADTAMLHVVAAAGPEEMRTGMRVVTHWKVERRGHVTDIAAWVPLPDGAEPLPAPPLTHPPGEEVGDVVGIVSPSRLEYRVPAGQATRRYLRGLAEGKIIGGRAPHSTDVYAASRGTDPKTGEPTTVEVEVSDRGIVTTFCVVNIPGLSELAPPVPYVSAQIKLDGADNHMFGLIRGVDVDDVRMGMRVAAVWADELKPDHRSIKWWEPTGEPDAPYDEYREYL